MIEETIDFATNYFGIEKEDIISHSAKGNISLARCIIWHYLHVDNNVLALDIAKRFDRTKRTIFYSTNKTKIWLEYQKCFRDTYYAFKHDFEESLKKE